MCTRITAIRDARFQKHTVGNKPTLFFCALCVIINGVFNVGIEEGKDRHIVARKIEYQVVV